MRLFASMLLTLLVGMLAVMVPAEGHHSQAPFFDQNQVIEIEGVVQRFIFRNPHPLIYIEVTEENGEKVAWSVQGANATSMSTDGWSDETVAVGEVIRAKGHPSKAPGTHGIQCLEVVKEDGTVVPVRWVL